MGVLSVTTGAVKLEFKNIWKELVAIIIIILWANFGNNVYSNEEHHYDWFLSRVVRSHLFLVG